MKKHLVVLVAITGFAVAAFAAGPRTLTHSLPADALETIDLTSGIGDVQISAREGADEVSIEVLLTPRRGGFFSSKRKAEQEVEAASLKTHVKGTRLEIGIDPPADDDRRFEERWTVEMPTTLFLTLTHGVGDVIVEGARAGLEIDSGVGDVRVDARSGDINIDLGVGTAVVSAPAESYGSAEGAGGVGDARLTVRGEKISSGGFVGHSARWTGDGRDHIEVSVGVGDAVIKLD
jgi:hypothetical protein